MSALSAVSNLVSSVFSVIRPDLGTPTTPTFRRRATVTSPVVETPGVIYNTPTKLERFLEAAQNHGVPGVQAYSVSLSQKGYGPDILHHVSVNDLVEVGVSPGDAIRLREYASKWWAEEHQRVAKRPRVPDPGSGACHATSTPSAPPIDSTPPSKRLRFEKRFYDGGGMTTWGRAVADMRADYEPEETDYTWWVYSKDLQMAVPIPPGKLPILADDPPYTDDAGNVF